MPSKMSPNTETADFSQSIKQFMDMLKRQGLPLPLSFQHQLSNLNIWLAYPCLKTGFLQTVKHLKIPNAFFKTRTYRMPIIPGGLLPKRAIYFSCAAFTL
jgi:hypothetical protein